jgi:protein lin-9
MTISTNNHYKAFLVSHTGIIDAVESAINSYRIKFDRPGLGTHSIPDYEVYANEEIDTLPIISITKDFRTKHNVPYYTLSPLQKTGPLSSFPMKSNTRAHNKSDPLLGGDSYPIMNKMADMLSLPKTSIGGFPLKLLELIIRMKKTLSAKQMKIMRLKNMNAEAEIYKSYGDPFPDDFQKRYANLIVGMEKLNRDMQDYLAQIQNCAKDVIKEPQALALLTPFYLREKCREMGTQTVDKNNGGAITDTNMIRLISDLSMIMWVASNLNNNDQYSHVMKVLESCMEETKSRLDPENIPIFQKSVQAHMLHIQLGLGHLNEHTADFNS